MFTARCESIFVNVLHVNFSCYGLGMVQRSVAGLSPREAGFGLSSAVCVICGGQTGTGTG